MALASHRVQSPISKCFTQHLAIALGIPKAYSRLYIMGWLIADVGMRFDTPSYLITCAIMLNYIIVWYFYSLYLSNTTEPNCICPNEMSVNDGTFCVFYRVVKIACIHNSKLIVKIFNDRKLPINTRHLLICWWYLVALFQLISL